MDEGVRYWIGPSDNFIVERFVNTTSIQPHPGGAFNICLGFITASLTERRGEVAADGRRVARIPPQFHLKMSLTDGGKYQIAVDGKVVGEKFKESKKPVEIRFGFVRDSHDCARLSHAYVSEVPTSHSLASESDDSSETETWED